jgi:hypothetical protein
VAILFVAILRKDHPPGWPLPGEIKEFGAKEKHPPRTTRAKNIINIKSIRYNTKTDNNFPTYSQK